MPGGRCRWTVVASAECRRPDSLGSASGGAIIAADTSALPTADRSVEEEFGERIAALEAKLAAAQAATPLPAPMRRPRGTGSDGIHGARDNAKVFNPDTSVIANLSASPAKMTTRSTAIGLSEVEAAFQAIVDPYARATSSSRPAPRA